MSDAARIAELELEVTRLRGELVRYKPAPIVLKPDGPFSLPTEEQVERLIARVLAKYPMLRPETRLDRIEPGEFIKMVRSSLRYIGTLYRLRGAVDRRVAYLDRLWAAGDFATLNGGYSTIRGSSFMVAAIASGDVCFSPPSLWPTTADVGLALGPTSGSYSASNKWLNTLTGQFDPSLVIEPPQPLHASAPPVVDIGRNIGWRQQL
jgi:hypothetical protein